MPQTVAVFFGGNSNEREISVITGMLAVNLLRRSQYRVVPVYLPPSGGMATGDFRSPGEFGKKGAPKLVPVRLEGRDLVRAKRPKTLFRLDCALNCCHGGMGEDGTLAALLKFHGVPSASPDVPMSAVFMDKTLTKLAVRGLGIPTARSFTVTERDWENRDAVYAKAEAFGYPVIVKPAKLGSSIGIKVAGRASELSDALTLAFRLDDRALVEEYFADRRDVNCAAYAKEGEIILSPLEEVFSQDAILTFSEKYESAGARRSEKPARLPAEIAEKIRTYTRLIYNAFGGRGVVRADYLVAGDGVYFNELNTVPGSLACYLFAGSLSESRNFLVSLVSEALNAPPMSKEVLPTGILDGDLFRGKGKLRR